MAARERVILTKDAALAAFQEIIGEEITTTPTSQTEGNKLKIELGHHNPAKLQELANKLSTTHWVDLAYSIFLAKDSGQLICYCIIRE